MAISAPISKKIVFIPLLLITAFILAGYIILNLHFSKTAVQRYEKDLIQLAHSGVQMLEFLNDIADMAELDHFADTFAEGSRFRITLIGLTGVVLGDSRLSLEEVYKSGIHSKRPEIIQARDSGVGISRRYSDALNIDLLYVALRYNNPGRKGYFRVALPLTELDKELTRQRLMLGGFCVMALVVAGSISLLMSRYLLILVKKGESHLEQRVRKRTKEIEIIQNLGTQLTACNTIEEAIKVICLVTSVLLPRMIGTLARPTPSNEKLEIVTSWNGDWHHAKFYTPDQCWSLRTGRPHMGNSNSGNISCTHSQGHREGMLCIPLVAQGITHGVLHFSNPESAEFTTEEIQLASAVAENASLTFASLELRENLRQQAIRDPLTGLYNRRYLLEAMDQELSRAVRHKHSLGVMMIDLDHFKQFNDHHGHDTGDSILREFGRLINKIIREEDIACRYGGEEFTVLLPQTERDQTFFVAEKIRKMINTHTFNIGHRNYGPITVSIGIATYPENGDTIESLLKLADQSLYASKENGRDQVMLAPLPEDTPGD